MFGSREERESLQGKQDSYPSQEQGAPAHHCTDVPCCIIFIAAIAVLVSLYAYGVAEGDLEKLFHGIDTEGRICGYSSGVEDKPMLYWCANNGFPASGVDLSHPVCVADCPALDSSSNLVEGVSGLTVEECSGIGMTAAYETVEFIHRYCMPDDTLYSDIYNSILEGPLDKFGIKAIEAVSGVGNAWPAYIACFVLAILIGILYMCFLRCCSGPCIFISCFLGITMIAVLGVYIWVNAEAAGNNSGHEDTEHWLRGLAIGLFVVAALLMCAFCCLLSSLRYAAACIEVAVECMMELPILFLVPIVNAVIKVGVFFVLLVGALYILSTADVQGEGAYRTFDVDQRLWILLITYSVIAIWIMCYMKAFYQYVLAFAVVAYYYVAPDAYGYKDMSCGGLPSVITGMCNATVFHVGSLALGSFIITLFHIVERMIQAAKKINQEHGDNPVVKVLLCCCLCCVTCCDEFVSFVNKNVYIQIAINSDGFCSGLREVISVFSTFGGTIALLNGATYVMEVFGVLLISASCALLCYAMVTNGPFVREDSAVFVDDPGLPTAVGALIGALVGISFMTVFDMVSDTLLYCFGFDSKSGRLANTAPRAFRELLHDHDH